MPVTDIAMSSIRAALSELRIDRKADTPKQPSWISFGILLVFLVLGFFLVEIAAFFWWRTQMWDNDVRTEIVTASVAGPRIVLNASGYIVARRVATVSSIVTGRVRDLLVEEGMKVKQGDVLARLDDSDAKAGFQLAKAQLGCASIATEQTKVQLDLAEKTLRRVTALANTKVETDEALDQAKAKVNSLKAQLDQQEAQILVAEGQVAVLEQQVQDTIIRAPFSGIVTSKDAEPGEMISPIASGAGFSRTGICTIVDGDSLEVEIEVNQNHLRKVTPGQSVTVTLDAYPEWPIPATVLAIIPTADRNKGTVKVRIRFKNKDERILPQMEARAAFLDTNQKPTDALAVLVPRIAIRDMEGGDFVWIVRDGCVQRRAITVADNVGDKALVSAGLQAGDTVVIESHCNLSQGARVKESKS